MHSLTKNRNQVKNVTVASASASVVYAKAASFGGCSKFEVWPGGGVATGCCKSITAMMFYSVAYRVELVN